ncbi:GAF domain-containing protein [uncultured Thiodictyon sp.]|uniref:GAF domain-containing protein n=1 Tax=uncultured Thiodictyon sp. TaxID=1846217 RepID=UPI0025D5F6E9|nr:GAF domain-containing protein [uncultured Thiodictyon sp.]
MHPTDIETAPGAELLALQQVARIVARADDAESRIQDILRHLDESAALVRGRVMLADPAAGELYIRYAHGLTPAQLERGRYRIGEGVSGRVFQSGVAALVANVLDEPGYLARAVALDALPPEQVAFLAVPIVRDHLPVGVLAAHRRRDPERSARSDLALLEVVATLLAQILCTAEQTAPAVVPVWRDLPVASPVANRARRDPDHAGRDLTLRTAAQRHAEGRLHQAADLYLKVVGQHPGTESALRAAARLVEIAQYYEARGATRLALDVLDRLQRSRDEGDSGGGRPAPRERSGPWDDSGFGAGEWDAFGDSEGSGGIGIRVR